MCVVVNLSTSELPCEVLISYKSVYVSAFRSLMLLVERQEGHPDNTHIAV